MHPIFPIGRVVIASSQAAAIELFENRKEYGIGGVIFTPEINIPTWTPEQKTALSGTKLLINPVMMQATDESALRDVWKRNAGEVAFKLVELSKKFNHTNQVKGVWFVENDEIKFSVHRDVVASAGMIHLHVAGPGMVCLTPTGLIPFPVPTNNAAGTNFDKDVIKQLFLEGMIEPITMQPKQAIAFDDTMVHFSQSGERFRILTLDK